jgi:hypothetical protein
LVLVCLLVCFCFVLGVWFGLVWYFISGGGGIQLNKLAEES